MNKRQIGKDHSSFQQFRKIFSLGAIFLIVGSLTGCASKSGIVENEEAVVPLGNGKYEILDVDYRGIFGSENSLKDSVLEVAQQYADSMGKQVNVLHARRHRVGVLGDWAWFYLQFALLDKTVPSSQITSIDQVGIVRDERLAEEFSKSDRKIPREAERISVADELLKLEQLRESGVLTEEEFEQQKKRLLKDK